MLEKIKAAVCEANIALHKNGLVTLTWGNASQLDPESGYIVIKPSGVSYEDMTPDDMVVVDSSGRTVEGKLKPSSDTPTHLVLYKKLRGVLGVAHTHSRHAAAWAQAGRGIPPYGTTHADYFAAEIPCTRMMTDDEILNNYEENTGNVICELFENRSFLETPAALVYSHGPFTWGLCARDAVEKSIILEEVAMMACLSEAVNPAVRPMQNALLEKHFYRKHGENAYYGQK